MSNQISCSSENVNVTITITLKSTDFITPIYLWKPHHQGAHDKLNLHLTDQEAKNFVYLIIASDHPAISLLQQIFSQMKKK